jgi:hypothetical protein
MRPRCEALILRTAAWARAAMKTCSAGGRTLSWVPINAKDRMVFHAGGPEGSCSALAASGSWVGARIASCWTLRSAPKSWRYTLGLTYWRC